MYSFSVMKLAEHQIKVIITTRKYCVLFNIIDIQQNMRPKITVTRIIKETKEIYQQ